MKKNTIYIAFMYLTLLGIITSISADINKLKKPVFDTTNYLNKNISNEQFFVPMKILYEKKLLPFGSEYIDIKYLRELALSLPESSVPYILDIESWKCGYDVDDFTASNNIDKYILVIDTMKKVRPDLKFGYFGIIPVKAQITEGIASGQRIKDWKHALERTHRLVDHVDILCPEGYTYFNNQDAWMKYMDAMISEAKSYGKPIYPFLWPEFMPTTPLKGKFIPIDFWKYQLEYIYKNCDGVIIWGGRDFTVTPTKSKLWDEEAEWWIETKKIILKNKNNSL